MMQAETLIHGSRSRKRSRNPSQQFLRYRNDSIEESVRNLLERDDLNDDIIRQFCAGAPITTDPHILTRLYRKRRQEIYELLKQLETGGARIDEYGRLVKSDNTAPPQRPIPPVPLEQPHAIPDPVDENQQINIALAEEQAAVAVIARAVQRYREDGVNVESLRLVQVRPPLDPRPHNNVPVAQARRPQGLPQRHNAVPPQHQPAPNRLTLRRIFIAAATVVTAFVCTLLQTLPLWHTHRTMDMQSDEEFLSVFANRRDFLMHYKDCPGLHRATTSTRFSWQGSEDQQTGKPYRATIFDFLHRLLTISLDIIDMLTKGLLYNFIKSSGCDEGVLHIPAQSETQIILGNSLNVTWFLPCRPPSGLHILAAPKTTCAAEQICFRGIHDGLISDRQIQDTIRLGSQLIEEGNDHFDIHFDITILQKRLASVIKTLKTLIRDQYIQGAEMEPVAFRVSAVGSIHGDGVSFHSNRASSNYLTRLLNHSNYIRWMERAERRNELAETTSLPWPFNSLARPVRDTCNLLADLEADPRFLIQSTIFLSEGGGIDFQGGTALFVDYDEYRKHTQKIRRGIAVEGSRGRILISSGGLENLRCRLPTRSGVRATIQIWWHHPG